MPRWLSIFIAVAGLAIGAVALWFAWEEHRTRTIKGGTDPNAGATKSWAG